MKPSRNRSERDPRLELREMPERWYRLSRRGINAILGPVLRLCYGFRIQGAENAEAVSGGAVTVCNHVHTLDCVMLSLAFPGRRLWCLSLPDNLTLPVAGVIVRNMGAIAVPSNAEDYREFCRHMKKCFAAGQWLQVYPEGELISGCRELRPFHPGAFRFSLQFQVPIIPCVLRTYRRRWPFRRGLELVILPPVYPEQDFPKREAVHAAARAVRGCMEQALYAVNKTA